MTPVGWLEIIAILALVVGTALPLGAWMALVFSGEKNPLEVVLGPIERAIYAIAGIDPKEEQSWQAYAIGLLMFNGLGIVAVFVLQLVQGWLPLNPQGLPGVAWDSSWNTAVSFVTNTNWQGYVPEVTMSYLTQMMGLTVQNFASAATGIVIAVALARGFARRQSKTIGNFWVDLVRCHLYLLIPLSFVIAIVLVSQGVVQTFHPYATAQLLQPQTGSDGTAITTQVLALGPAASQIAIKQLGTNGGGFFNANSAHPFENPTPFTNLVEIWGLLVLAVGLCETFGRQVNDRRQGRALFATMAVIFVPLLMLCVVSESWGNPHFTQLGLDQTISAVAPGGNMEGKEERFGVAASALFAAATTTTSCGAVNSMHDSFTPLGGLVTVWNIELGELVFGGVGSGLYCMLMYAIVAVFIAGLMVGRTPEYLGKKIEAWEMKMASLTILLPAGAILVGTAIAVTIPQGTSSLWNTGAHGFSEALYAFSSATQNNGSAFAGISANVLFYNLALSTCMLIGRFACAIPALAIAGSLANKKALAVGPGTLPTHGPLFVVLLVGTVVLVGALNYLPALALGPIVEHLKLWS